MAMAFRLLLRPFDDSFRVDKIRGLEAAVFSSELDADPDEDEEVLLEKRSFELKKQFKANSTIKKHFRFCRKYVTLNLLSVCRFKLWIR